MYSSAEVIRFFKVTIFTFILWSYNNERNGLVEENEINNKVIHIIASFDIFLSTLFPDFIKS